MVAVTLVFPAAIPTNRPEPEMVATDGLEEVQLAVAVMSDVEPSL
jgi:hypothetical protein